MRTTTGGVQLLAPDHQGTSQLAINSTTQTLVQRRYTPFGTIRGQDENDTWPDEKGFVGGTNDPGTGLVHLGAREYDPTTGRFITVDPLIDPDDAQSLNGYAYAGNNPVTFNDATGLCRDVNPIMGPISCHAPGNDGKPHDVFGNPNPGGRVYKGSPSRYNPSRYHYSYNPQLKKHRPSPPVKKCDLSCKLKKGVKKGLSEAGNHVQNNWRKYLSWGSFAARMVVSGGTCLAIGVGGALVTLGADLLNPNISKRRAAQNFGINVLAAAGGGYMGKVLSNGPLKLTRGWGGVGWKNNVLAASKRRWPSGDWVNAARRPVKWGYVSRVVTVRASVRSGVCAATSCALYG